MKKKFAFTLIEVLIAITVFAIGVLAVLRVLTWNLWILDHAKMKLQSTVLAKEWLELLYNLRDSNLEKKLQRNCVLNQDVYSRIGNDWAHSWEDRTEDDICSDYFGNSNKFLQVSFDETNYLYQNIADYTGDFDSLFEENKLCLFSGAIWNSDISWYAYCWDSSWESTFFARYLSFTWVKIDEWQNVLDSDKILKVEAHVLYKKWHKTGDIVFESFIWNY